MILPKEYTIEAKPNYISRETQLVWRFSYDGNNYANLVTYDMDDGDGGDALELRLDGLLSLLQ